jgi:hypothetical protein
LAVAEVALALVLLVCAGLMINTVVRILHADPGFNPSHLLTMEIRLTWQKIHRRFVVGKYRAQCDQTTSGALLPADFGARQGPAWRGVHRGN